jgi:hypothetical protein
MSYLNGPRINFWGGGSTNVDTANNGDPDQQPLVDVVNTVVTAAGTDEQIIADLRKPSTQNGQNYYTVAGWNYYGDHQVAFRGAKVSSAGKPGGVSTADPLVNLPVYLLGSVDPLSGDGPYGGAIMADLDPTSSQSTQIYVGGLQIGGSDKPALLVRADARCHSHLLGLRYDTKSTSPPFLTPGSAWANGTFQVAFPREAVVQYDRSLATLAAVVDAPGAIGIVVRFCMFEFMPGMSTDEIQANYAANYNDVNPSLGRIIGTVGPWFPDEPATCPVGRLLGNTQLGGALGLAHLDAAENRLTLDLSSALPGAAIRKDSRDVTSPIGPNVDYGDLLIGAAGQVLAKAPSLPAEYYLYGGVYDVPLDPAAVQALQQKPITIGSTRNGLSIVESPVRIFSDVRNVYLDDAPGARTEVTVLVRHLGGALPTDLAISLSTDVSGALPDPKFLDFPATVTAKAGQDRVTFGVGYNGGDPGFLALNFVYGTDPKTLAYFINFRKYPADDHAAVTGDALTWDFVYETCLRYYYVLFPAMSKRIPLNDGPTIAATAGEILKRFSPEYHDTTLRMPVTRSMSPGKVALLRAYLEKQVAGGG